MAKSAGDLKRGNAVRIDGEVMTVVELNHVKPGKGPAYLQAKLRSLKTGGIREMRFRITESVDTVYTDRRKCTYSYRSGDDFVFMDEETFEEYTLPAATVGEEIRLFAEGETLEIETADGVVTGLAYPDYVARTVVQTMSGVKKAAVTNQTKPAELDTGIEVAVPIFIETGERIRIHVASGKYHEREK
ncbi:MAG: elongation factor P [Planctomycetota bacterium]